MDFTPLDAGVVRLWRRRGLGLAAPLVVASVVAVVAAALADGPVVAVALVGALLSAAAIGLTRWLPERWYAHWAYRLDDVALEIRHGAIIRRRSVIPYFRVQHVDTSTGPLERSLGLASLKIHTASSKTDAEIPGLADATAAELRAQIVARAGLSEGV